MLLLCMAGAAAARKKADPPERPFEVHRLGSAAAGEADESFVYALPRTILRIKVVVERRQFTRGVYAEYAEKYLGIADAKRKNMEQYAIHSIEVAPLQEADPDHIYAASPVQNAASAAFFKMQKTGLMLGLPLPSHPAPPAVIMSYDDDWAVPTFTDMGCEVAVFKNISSKNPAFADVSKNDSPPPVLPTALPIPKSREARAMEASKILTQLRKRRLELITGEIEAVFANGEALKTALAEIKEIERQYLELFVGRAQVGEAEYYYDIAPVRGKDRYPLFFFAPDIGINTDTGAEITLHLQCPESAASAAHSPAAYKYRIPCVSDLRITDGEDDLFRGRYLVFQYGPLVNMMP